MAAKKNNRPGRRQNVTAGTTIRLQPPASYDRQPKPVIPEIEVIGGFKTFLREHAVVALAIGFVVATQIQSLARELIASFIDPAFKLLFGTKLSLGTVTMHFNGRSAQFGWGAFVYALVNVLFVLIAIYIVVRIFRLEKLENPKKKPKKDETVVRYKFEEKD